jgi:DHA1 family bicyclomycin/chloramphenicol resistance-like MFS transporter
MRPVPAWLPVLLGFLQAVGPVSTDMYLPAFPAIEASFHAPAGSAEITLAAWVVGLSIGQLMQGVLADRFGRRWPLLAGTLVYIAGSAGCAVAGGIAVMSGWRFLAALGASASMVIPRAIVRDISEGQEAARIMSRLILVLGAAPILAPTLGGVVLAYGSWRDIFWINAGYGAVALLAALATLPDTLPTAARVKVRPLAMLRRYWHILGERGFLTHALMLSFNAFALFAYLGGTPGVFIRHYHLLPWQFGMVFGVIAAAYVCASQLNIRAVRLFDLDGTLARASSVYLIMACGVLMAALTDAPAGWLIVLLAIMQSMMGFTNPNATVGALRHHGAHAGSASAVLGTMQFFIGASSGFLVGYLTDGTAVPMALLILGGALAAKLADLNRPRAA